MKRLVIITASLLLACFASAQNARPPAPVFPSAPPPPYVAPDTPQGSGPYPAVMLQDPTLPSHTIYVPAKLSALGGEKLPIVAWANGACVNVGNRFRYFLTEIASHGYLAIANGTIERPGGEGASLSSKEIRGNPAPGSPAALRTPDSPKIDYIPSDTTPQQLIDAIDWAIKENSRPGSKYYGKLDTSKIAVMGQSCGGLQAIVAAHDPRVSALGVWNSGLFSKDGLALRIAAADAPKSILKTLKVPVIYVTGEPSDVAYNNADDDFSRIEGVPALRVWREKTGHTGTYREPNGGAFGKVAVAWLQWQLKGEKGAAKMFLGPDCGLCRMPEWHVRKKNLD